MRLAAHGVEDHEIGKGVNFLTMRASYGIWLSSLLLAAMGLVTVPASAQMVASRDLTSGWRPPSDHIALPQSCEQPRSSIADEGQEPSGAQKNGKNLELTIVSIVPSKLEIDADFVASVRLKNVGPSPVLIPAVADGEQLSATAAGTEEKFEVGDITFRLATGSQHRAPVFLSSAGALFANPGDEKSYVTLKPGNWLDMKIHGAVQCGAAQCLGGIQPDKKAVLTAWWYQRILTHKVNGCEETHGSHDVREVDSLPFTVEVNDASPKMSARVW